jgi:preprotein translocase subunit SecF
MALCDKKIGDNIMKFPSYIMPKRKGDKLSLIQMRKWWYIISLAIILPGTIALALWGLKPSIDFTGGSKMELRGVTDVSRAAEAARGAGLENVIVQKIGSDGILFRFKEIDEAKHKEVTAKLRETLGEGTSEARFETVGPAISKELTRNAFISVILASLVIIIYVAISFRKVPFPANSWEFGITAVIAILHDVLVVCGLFAILGHYYNVEIDPLFITALLTVVGFSVHDTIVIFDRIRENLIKKGGADFEETVNISVVEMLPRTINTSFLVWVILLILLIFGGSTIRFFVLALVVGVFSGTYSSILNAAPLLVTWHNLKKRLKVGATR